ncbi:hypothetical protein E5Q_01223 [Mixia osmundae IAM 14324]|uniref:RING-type domain-containing protein n=1 Tax=Mixia osmundae (strain CBS 9802 / IAM 14324 / JCM 22182 / KY 12970) TaxID=764103 RepID=G7DVG2_MIXOS|nr:hypothetical protein E5Q_01223 [Mixia osmundae IAM 14324]
MGVLPAEYSTHSARHKQTAATTAAVGVTEHPLATHAASPAMADQNELTAALASLPDSDNAAAAGDADPPNGPTEAATQSDPTDSQVAAIVDPSSTPASPVEPQPFLTPAMRLRAGLARRMLIGLNGLGGHKRISLMLTGWWTIAQIVAFIVVLAVTHNDPCDQPLRAYLAVHVVRIALVFPINFYQALNPVRDRDASTTAEDRAEREARRVLGSPLLDSRVILAHELLSILGLVMFVLGNVWYWSANTCRRDAPPLYWSSLITLITGYFYAAEVIFVVFSVLFFLPLVILLLRSFGVYTKKHEIGPLSKEEMEKLPLVLFVPLAADAPTTVSDTAVVDTTETATATATITSPTEPITENAKERSIRPSRRRRRLARLFTYPSRHRSSADKATTSSLEPNADEGGPYVRTPYPLRPLAENQATCSICLCDYEPPPLRGIVPDGEQPEFEPLRLLPCGHCLHKECVDAWFLTSGRCPICQADVRPAPKGKAQASSSNVEADAA